MRRLFLLAFALTILLPLLAVMLVFLAAAGESAAQCGTSVAGASGPVGGVPAADIPMFQGAAARFGLGARGPSILAAINYVESTFGQSNDAGVHSGANYAGAMGPMQFLQGTWDTYKVQAPGGAVPPNVYDEADAVYSAANYLKASGAPADWPGAIFAYNHASWYVQKVLSQAASYYTQGLTAQGSATSTTASSGSSGATSAGSPFSVPAASGDPAGPITLAPGQPTIVAATYFTDQTGAWGDNLHINSNSYAELSPGIPGSQVTKQNATMLGGLPYMTPLRVTNPQNGRTVIIYKRDIGAGQPMSNTLGGYHYRIDLTQEVDQQLGLPGSGIVQVTRLTGPVSTPGGGQACSASSGFAPAGSGIDPIPGFTIGRDDMGVDASAPVGSPIYAPLDSRLVEVVSNWYAGQPLLLFQFLQRPAGAPTDYWYVAEQITPVSTTTGTIFHARQAVARYAPSGTAIEIGWGSPTSSGRTLAQQMGDSAAANPPAGATTTWGESFKRFFGIH